MISSSLSIDRTGLSLSPLVLANNPAGAYVYPEDGLAQPNFEMRRTYAPDSRYTPGRLLLGAVLDGTTIPLTVTVRGTSAANLLARKAELEAAVAQFAYTVTMTVAGVEVGAWPADPTAPWWGVVDHADAAAFLAVGTLAIPVNPPVA
jgi:hypothetical protein